MRDRAKNFEFHVELETDGRLARRRTELLPDGAYLFEDELKVCGHLNPTVITCAAWLLELYELQAGALFFISGKEEFSRAL